MITRRQFLEKAIIGGGLIGGSVVLSGCDLVEGLFGVAKDKETLDDLADDYKELIKETRSPPTSSDKTYPKKTKIKKTISKPIRNFELEEYFLQKDELTEYIKLCPKNFFYEFCGNPHISSKREIASIEWDKYNDGLIGLGDAHYCISSNDSNEFSRLTLLVQQFKDKVSIEKVISANKYHPPYDDALNFVLGNFWIAVYFLDESNKKQAVSFWECLLNYNKKRGCEVVVDRQHITPEDFRNGVIRKIQKINK